MSFPVYMTANAAAPVNILGTCQPSTHTHTQIHTQHTEAWRWPDLSAQSCFGRCQQMSYWRSSSVLIRFEFMYQPRFILISFCCSRSPASLTYVALSQPPLCPQDPFSALLLFYNTRSVCFNSNFFSLPHISHPLFLSSSCVSTAERFRSPGEHRAECRCSHRLFSSAGRCWHQLRKPQGQESPGPGGRQRHAAAYQELLWETQVRPL